ncbi:MAG: sugar transferase [Lentisphaerae bacterium]|nr:sugar transferase [Lentisphaerota bacterium]
MFDLALLAVTAVVWVPLLLIVALAVWLGMGRPVLFRQVRAGKQGRPFELFKFRTMREGEESDAERLTPFGRRLRASSLDELPQLLNVLRGEMALVGPRPLPVRYLPRYSQEQARRHDVRPGLTGWAQVNGRNAISWAEKFKLDVWYIEHQCLWLDLRILGLTALKILRREGIACAGEATMGEFLG